MKLHPLFRQYLEGGEMVEWGAKTIPEGGYYSVPSRRSGDGLVILGDSAGFVDVPSLKGIHYAIQSGIFAARVIFQALQAGEATGARLAGYDRLVEAAVLLRRPLPPRDKRLPLQGGVFRRGAQG